MFHAYLLIGKNKEKLKQWVADFICRTKTQWTDIFQIEPIKGKIIITQIRELIHWANLAPYESAYKIAVIFSAETMLKESANALLKTLEEPPRRVIIILAVSDKDAVLPTIRSRCRLIKANAPPAAQLSEEKIILSDDIGENFALAESLAKDEELISKLDQLILDLRKKLLLGEKKAEEKLKKILQAKKLLLTTNVNPRLLLENLFLDIVEL